MGFWGGLTLIVALHVLVNSWLQPRVEQGWNAASASQKVAKSGTLAALQTLGDFLRIAALTFGAVAALFMVLQWVAPSTTLGVIAEMQGLALATRDAAKDVGGWLGRVLFWIGVAGAFLVIWSLTLASYRETLVVEYLRQLRGLVVSERQGKLDALPSTADMRALVAEHTALGDDGSEQAQRRRSHRLRYLDLVRRIDLGKQSLPLGVGGTKGRLLRLLFSEGMVEVGKNSTKRLGKVATAATCVLLLGVTSPALRSGLVEPTIDTLAGLRIERELASNGTRLQKLAEAPPVPAVPDDPDYRAVAEQFLDALAENRGWASVSARLVDRPILPAADASIFDDAFERMVARDAVTRSFASDPAGGTRHFALDDLPTGDTGRIVLNEMRQREGGAKAVRAAALDRLEQALRQQGGRVPAFREKLKKSLASFNRPARLSTFATLALGDQFALAVGAASPGPGGQAVFDAEAVRSGQKGLQKSFEQIVQVRFASFVSDIAAGRPLGTALGRVQADGLDLLMRRRDAAAVSALLDNADLRRNAYLARGFKRPAILAAAVDRADAKAVEEAMASPDWKKRIPMLAQYDDLLPGTAMALPTSLGLAANRLGRPRGTMILPSGVSGSSGRISKVKLRGGSLIGLALTAASLAVAEDEAAASSDQVDVDGVTVQWDPSMFGYKARDLKWQFGAQRIRLRADESGEQMLPRGPVDPAVVEAALALAADGRPAALIVSPVKEARIMRWLLHPVITDTRIGADLIRLYERSGGLLEVGSFGVQTFEIESLTVLADADKLGISRDLRDFLALATIFRSAFKGDVDIQPAALMQLARELEPYGLDRVPTPRSSSLTDALAAKWTTIAPRAAVP